MQTLCKLPPHCDAKWFYYYNFKSFMILCIFSLVTDFIIFCCKICLHQDKSFVSGGYYHYYIFKLLLSLFLPSFVMSLWRCCMMCGESWRRIETLSEMTFCSSSKTAGKHMSSFVSCILVHQCNQLAWTSLFDCRSSSAAPSGSTSSMTSLNELAAEVETRLWRWGQLVGNPPSALSSGWDSWIRHWITFSYLWYFLNTLTRNML